jgi:hypothetical protein|eukprot:6024751-Prymnesium_polylepis.1
MSSIRLALSPLDASAANSTRRMTRLSTAARSVVAASHALAEVLENDDLVSSIFTHLDIPSLVSACSIDRSWWAATGGLWRRLLQHRWPMLPPVELLLPPVGRIDDRTLFLEHACAGRLAFWQFDVRIFSGASQGAILRARLH